MYLKIGDNVRHVFDPRVVGRIVEIRQEKSQTMTTGGTFMNRKYALVEVTPSDRRWILFDDIMKND